MADRRGGILWAWIKQRIEHMRQPSTRRRRQYAEAATRILGLIVGLGTGLLVLHLHLEGRLMPIAVSAPQATAHPPGGPTAAVSERARIPD